jgi:hypothetical protein
MALVSAMFSDLLGVSHAVFNNIINAAKLAYNGIQNRNVGMYKYTTFACSIADLTEDTHKLLAIFTPYSCEYSR